MVKEWSTLDELLHIEQDWRHSEWNLQSMLVQLRILSSLSSKAVSRYLWPFAQIFNKERHEKLQKLERAKFCFQLFSNQHALERMTGHCILESYENHYFQIYIFLEILKAFRGWLGAIRKDRQTGSGIQ